MYTFKQFITGVVATVITVTFLSQQVYSQKVSKGVKNLVLVHGAFADGSSWERVIPVLHAKGYNVIAVQNPLTSLEDDVAATRRAIALMDGPVLLVAHSYGGMVITEAGNDPKVAGLLYVCALVPNEGQSAGDVVNAFPPGPGSAEFKQDASGFLSLSYKGINADFAQDLPAETRSVLFSTQIPWSVKATMGKVTTPAWKTKPSWFIIGKNDRMVPPGLQRVEAKMIKAHTLELPSSHVPMFSMPERVAAFIVSAAQEVK